MNAHEPLPRIAITMGDAAGIGPEVVVRAWMEPKVHRSCRPFAVGHAEVFRREVRALDAPLEVIEVRSPADALQLLKRRPAFELFPPLLCLSSCDDAVVDVVHGKLDARAGRAAYDALWTATELALTGGADAIVTAPLSKAGLHLAGVHYPGHTEILAERCGACRFAMMLYLPPGVEVKGGHGLGVVHATLHVALRAAIEQLTRERIADCCRLAHVGLLEVGAERPRIGICALNPHAGEEGLFGDEEISIIGPAAELARGWDLDVVGPLPADTLLCRARHGEFDAVVAMYHDQGHIALKLLGMHRAVNVTLGLPIVRTSPAHGTALDIAGTQRAECSGMVSAIETAARIAARRQLALGVRDSRSTVTSSQAMSCGEYSNQRLSMAAPKLTSEN